MQDARHDERVTPEVTTRRYQSWASSEAIRKTMAACRNRDTAPEKAVRSIVHRMGLRFRVSARPVPDLRRTADMVFRRAKVAVFVDGCYWHACPDHFRLPSTNVAYWNPKIAGNVARDRDTDTRLSAAGWSVLRFWEHEDPLVAANCIATTVQQRLA